MDINAPQNLELDLKASTAIREKCVISFQYAQNLYAALCNVEWRHTSYIFEILKNELWYCSWRYAGGLIAELRDQGEDYMDFYCSGIDPAPGCVGEGCVTDEIKNDLARLGWSPFN